MQRSHHLTRRPGRVEHHPAAPRDLPHGGQAPGRHHSADDRPANHPRRSCSPAPCRPWVALTFHLSGDPTWCQVLDAATQAGAPISLFAVGRWVAEHPDLVRRILADGHELNNHTWTHPVLGRLTGPAVAAEIRGCQAALTRATGSGGRYFRPSGMTQPSPLVLSEAGSRLSAGGVL